MGESAGCDVFIAGTGPVGAVYARKLGEAGLSVVMADAGRQRSRRPGEHLRNTHVYRREPALYQAAQAALLCPPAAGDTEAVRPGLPGAAVTYAVGGMGIVWNGICPRLHPRLEPAVPLPAGELAALYTGAEALLGVNREVPRGSRRQRALLEILGSAVPDARELPPEAAPLAAWRSPEGASRIHWVAPADVLGVIAERVTILEEHVVTRLLHRGGRVVAARLYDLASGESREIRAQVYVVAAGALLSPQLLWASDILRDGAGSSPLGRTLHDHGLAFAQVAMGGEAAVPRDDPEPFVAIPIQEGRPYHCLILPGAATDPTLAEEVDPRLILNFYWYALTEPREENRISWSDTESDLHGMPRPTFEHSPGPENRARARQALADLREVGGALGTFLPGSPPQILSPGRSMHFLGTTRMGTADDGRSVVDRDSRVWGFANLYVGGTGLFAGPSASNPTLTACALALRSAARILGEVPPSEGAA